MPSAAVLRNLARFGRVLSHNGLEAGPRRLQTAARGLDAMGLSSRDTVYWTLHSTFVSRREESAVFEAAFGAFWDRLLDTADGEDSVPTAGDAGGTALGQRGVVPVASAAAADDDHDDERLDAIDAGTSWSAVERLRHLDFSAYGPAELAAARAALTDVIRRAAPRRRSRRFIAANAGRELDRRRTLRTAMRTGGHPVQRHWREQRVVPRPLIFLIDVSGSMEPYARVLVVFAQVVLRAVGKVEVFSFGSRLTRLTPKLADRDAARALLEAGRAIPDWAGGTRIGDCLEAFNDTAGRRAITRGAVVVIVSDGCERGDPAVLGAAMARLRRAAHTVVWVNPLAGDQRYEPRTQGMLAALPFIDVLLPGHDLAALDSLAGILDAIPQHRVRRAAPE